ncbi:AMP-dependent synthetase/ligase [Dickeya chrysanthemi]|uniref:AMP-dependent synthetase/ligase n=1 Tax=Dickeya chrysanthemi TaxID=556 RepID=UPI0003A60785|nr:AMP-dependent synthetase/ligase [Dickeya chrysanthemi]MBX9447271.1 long-chain fatty acid--CoA ligase [Dickeya chrysanthemi]
MFLDMLEQQARRRPHAIALHGETRTWSWQQYHEAVITVAARLRSLGVKRLALEADNSPEWAIIDLACLAGEVVIIPVPPFFTEAQKTWVRASASIDAQIGGELLAGWQEHHFPFGRMQTRTISDPVLLPVGTAKITYTSGTTGEPKGVCLSQSGMFWTAQTLATALHTLNLDKHLVLLPLSILLENVCGLYIPLLLGAETVVLPPSRIGFEGSSRFTPGPFLQALTHWRPHSLVLVPELLRVLLLLHRQAPESTQSLRFIAAGGGKISASLLTMAEHSGLPVFEGYGLSECGSVVALNLPGAAKESRVGRPLPGIRVTVDDHHQLCVTSPANALGYLGAEPAPPTVATGDLGRIDEDGFLHIQGRLKNVQINAFGRNFSPEWPEAEAMACPAVRRIVIFGEGLRRNVALVDAFEGQQEQAREQLQALSARLPDYAQFHRLLFTSEISSPGMLTANGRPRRNAIWQSLEQHILTSSEEE